MSPGCATVEDTEANFFTQEELDALNQHPVPKHVAIIMDGNRRWARDHMTAPQDGHQQGADTLMDVVRAAKEIGVAVLTVYAFSTENWNRTDAEITILFQLIEKYLSRELETMLRNNVRLESIGDISDFPESLKQTIRQAKQATSHCTGVTLVLSLNYGSRDELRRAFQRMLDAYDRGELKREELSEDTISRYLDTAPWSDPDLLIRTSGELRVSNFLLWQISYAELYLTDTLWPDFTPHRFLEAIQTFQARERRIGQ